MTAACPPPLAALQNVQVCYPAQIALKGMSLQIHAGQVLALLGRNGAGKSTAISVLLGLRQPDAGSVQLFGGTPQQRQRRQQVGVMLQNAQLPDNLTVAELVRLCSASYPQPRPLAECLQIAGLDTLAQRRYGQLSGGQQRCVQFAVALCGRPRLLFLDEPTTGLDIQARQVMWQAIRQLVAEGCGVVLTTHYLEEAQALAQRVVVMAHGEVLADGPMDQFLPRMAPRRIRCRSVLDTADIVQWPGVIEAVREGGYLEVSAEPAEPVVARLLAADACLQELEVRSGSLADAFEELTREAA